MNSYPSLVLICSQAQEGAWNSFLNEVWEFFVDFNYPSYCWTSLVDIIENWLCNRTTGIPSSEAVTLVFSIPHSLQAHQQPPLRHTTLEVGKKKLKFFQCCISCDFSQGKSLCFISCFCNGWVNSGNIKGLEKSLILACLEPVFLVEDITVKEVKIGSWRTRKPGITTFVSLPST